MELRFSVSVDPIVFAEKVAMDPRTSFHHQPEAQHQKSRPIHNNAGRLPHLWVIFGDRDWQRCDGPDQLKDGKPLLVANDRLATSKQHRPCPPDAYGPATASALFNKASAIRMLAMSMSLPSSDTAPFPSFAASSIASNIRRALVTSAFDGVKT